MTSAVPIAVQLDEDNVGLVDPALRVFVAVVRHLDRDGGVLCILLAFSSLPVIGERGRVSTGGSVVSLGGRGVRRVHTLSRLGEQAANPAPSTPRSAARRLNRSI